MVHLRRRLDKMLFEGQGRQFLWLFMIIIVVLVILQIIGTTIGKMGWQEVLALFMDPGVYGNRKGDDPFRITVALLGAVLFSALLISVITNIFENISEAYKKGDLKYSFSDHILIIGASRPLKNMLRAIRDNQVLAKKDILIMTGADVEAVRENMKIHLGDSTFCNQIFYFHRERHGIKYLEDACASKAFAIYVIGEEEDEHDALNVRCLNLLKELFHGDGPVIPCYLIMRNNMVFNVFNYSKANNTSRLNIEVINQSDYAVERLFTNTDYLPAIRKSDIGKRAHVVIIGDSEISKSFATLAAQMCHYPNFSNSDSKTIISLIGYDYNSFEKFVSNFRCLFDLCQYRYVSKDNIESYTPNKEYGDFLDIEWEFIDGRLESLFVYNKLNEWIDEPTEETVIAICYDDDKTNADVALHLPRKIYDKKVKIAVCQNEYTELMEEASSVGMFGRLYIFGNTDAGGDPLFLSRTVLGKRVNRVYDLEYGNPPAANEDDAWRNIPYPHKVSSIASANSIPIKLRCFEMEPTQECIRQMTPEIIESMSEVEHRRWMTSQLLMGYSAATISERKDRKRFKELKNEKFIHLDIAPYSEIADEVNKDINIINNIPYIMTGVR